MYLTPWGDPPPPKKKKKQKQKKKQTNKQQQQQQQLQQKPTHLEHGLFHVYNTYIESTIVAYPVIWS